jgi:hypothetical protein
MHIYICVFIYICIFIYIYIHIALKQAATPEYKQYALLNMTIELQKEDDFHSNV